MDRLIRRVKQIRDFCGFRLATAWLQGGRCLGCGRFVGLRPMCGRCIAESEAEAQADDGWLDDDEPLHIQINWDAGPMPEVQSGMAGWLKAFAGATSGHGRR